MRDLHSHYLPNVDDGARSIEECEEMLSLAANVGITDILFTPHYILDSGYTNDVKTNNAIFKNIKKIAKKYGINIYLGNEVYCTTNIINNISSAKVTTLNGSQYLLIELSMYSKTDNIMEIIDELRRNEIIPILAHPERYTAYYNDIKFFRELVEKGVLLQINYPSLLGLYGKKAQKMAKKLLKKHIVSFIGSDSHNASNERYEKLNCALKKIKRYDKRNYEAIVNDNFLKVISNEIIK